MEKRTPEPTIWPLGRRLAQRGHEAIPVSLPAADDSAGLPEYVTAVVRAIGDRDPRRVVLVAQSIAGFTAPLVCARVPVALLVLVNAMIPKPGERAGEWWANTRQAEAKRENDRREGRRPDAPFDPLVEFFHDVPQRVIDEAWAQGEPRQAAPSSPHHVASRAGRTCPRACWSGATTASSPLTSSDAWRASGSAPRRTRCPAAISSRSVNRRS